MEPKNTFKDLYRTLDLKTKKAIGFSGFESFVAHVVTPYSLNEDQLSKLIHLTIHTIVGVEKKESFVLKISELLGVTPETSLSIASDINQKIINNIDNIYTDRLLIDEEYLDDEEELFLQHKIHDEIREYRNNINPQELINVLQGNVATSDMEHIIGFIKKSYPSIQKKVLSNGWVDKLNEVSLKYSLTKENTKTLISEVLLVMLDLEEKENISQNLQHEAGISSVLADQLSEEINDRIFKLNERPVQTPQITEVSENTNTHSLDIPPINLPGEIIGEENLTPSQTPNPTPIVENNVVPQPIPLKDIPIPQTTTITQSQQELTPQKPSFIANKLTQTTKPVPPPAETPKAYTIDPYREPIE